MLSNEPTIVTKKHQSCYTMVTRSKSSHLLARKFSFLIVSIPKEPSFVTKALAYLQWFRAMKEEFEGLMKNKTWVLARPNKSPLGLVP